MLPVVADIARPAPTASACAQEVVGAFFFVPCWPHEHGTPEEGATFVSADGATCFWTRAEAEDSGVGIKPRVAFGESELYLSKFGLARKGTGGIFPGPVTTTLGQFCIGPTAVCSTNLHLVGPP